MSSATKIIAGTEVPICLQIETGATDRFPQALIQNHLGATLAILDLIHISDGLYAPSSFYMMPSLPFIKAIYIVYEDAGHTSLDEDLGRDLDVFVKDDISGASDELINLITKALADLRAVEAEILIEEQDELDLDVINVDNGELDLILFEEDNNDIEVLVESVGEVSIDFTMDDDSVVIETSS